MSHAAELRSYAARINRFRFRSADDLMDFLDQLRRDMLARAAQAERPDDRRPVRAPEHNRATPGTIRIEGRTVMVAVRRRGT